MRPTILQILPRFGAGGTERIVLGISQGLVQAGWRSLVASQEGEWLPKLQEQGGEHFSAPIISRTPWNVRKAGKCLRILAKRENVDLVHAHGALAAWSARLAARHLRLPWVANFHGARSRKTRVFNRLIRAKGERILTEADRSIVGSLFLADHVRKHYQVPPERLRISVCGIDGKIHHPQAVSAQRKANAAREIGLSSSRMPVFLLPGRLRPSKGHRLLLRALTHMPDIHCRCIFGGGVPSSSALRRLSFHDRPGRRLVDGAYRKSLEKQARRSAAHILFCPVDADWAALYTLADVVVVPSLVPEGFGLVIAEAQALGGIVAASNHGGAKEQIVADKTGFLFSPGDSHDLARALHKALQMSAHNRLTMSEAASARALRLYRLENMQQQTIRVYRELLQKTSA